MVLPVMLTVGLLQSVRSRSCSVIALPPVRFSVLPEIVVVASLLSWMQERPISFMEIVLLLIVAFAVFWSTLMPRS